MSDILYSHDGYRLDGYRPDLEDYDRLIAKSTNVSHILQSRIDAPYEFDPRAIFRDNDPRDDMQVEDQGQQGSCAGHAGTSAVELATFIATRRMFQLSRGGLYYMAQEEDGIQGDQGSTIHGCSEVLRKIGVPLEEDWPYPSRYDPSPPGGITHQHELAAEFMVGSHTFLSNADDVLQYLKAGLGGVQIGITWGGDVDKYGVFRWRAEGGGHSVAFLGWKVINGDEYVWLLNSWGRKWGDDGWALVSMDTLDQMFRDRSTVMVGYSDMSNPDVRDLPVDFVETPTL